MFLLTRHRLLQLGVLSLQLAQAADISAVGGADEVGQHVHLAEHVPDEVFGRMRMRQDRPVGTRDFGALHGAVPECAEFFGGARLVELVDGRPMPAIERLLQQLGRPVPLAGQQHRPAMQLVVGLLAGARQFDLAQRKVIYGDLQKLIRRDLAILPLFQSFIAEGVKDGLQGFRPNINTSSNCWNAREWYWA